MTVKLYDNSEASLQDLAKDILETIRMNLDRTHYSIPDIEPKSDLIGIPDSVYTQIKAAIQSGKQHLIFYGPPGTGKTTLAQYIAQELSSTSSYEMLTASASWTSQELIGGYQPIGGGKIGFVPGAIVRNFDRPIVIDELNRCPIDKVIGPLFSVLSGQASTLPYKLNLEQEDSPFHVIYPYPKDDPEEHEWCPTHEWRIIATLNTIDKSQLGQISYALSRRFAWIKIGIPDDLDGFIKSILNKSDVEATTNPVADMWAAVNNIRQIGGAPIIDFIRVIQHIEPDINLLTEPDEKYRELLITGLEMYILPLLDGIRRYEAESLVSDLSKCWNLDEKQRQYLTSELVDMTL